MLSRLKMQKWSHFLLLFILATLPFERIPSFDVLIAAQPITVRLSQVGGLALILISLPTLWASKGQLSKSPWRWLVLFGLGALISAGVALNQREALITTGFIGFVGLLAWTISLVFDRTKLSIYLKTIIYSALVVIAFGFFQFFGDLLGLPTSLTGLREQYTQNIFGFPRIQSTGLEPLYFGNYLLIPIALAVSYYFYRDGRYLLTVLPLLTVLWMTVSRGAYAGAAATLAAVMVLARKEMLARQLASVLVVTTASVGIAAGLIAFGGTIDKKPTTAQTNVDKLAKQSTTVRGGGSARERAIARNVAWEAFKEHPVFGVGPGNFGVYAHRAMPQKFKDDSAIVNNEPFEILAEHGLLGAALFALFVFGLVKSSFSALSRLSGADRVWLVGLIGALAGIVVQYQTFSTLYITHIWVIIGLLIGIVYSVPEKGKGLAANQP